MRKELAKPERKVGGPRRVAIVVTNYPDKLGLLIKGLQDLREIPVITMGSATNPAGVEDARKALLERIRREKQENPGTEVSVIGMGDDPLVTDGRVVSSVTHVVGMDPQDVINPPVLAQIADLLDTPGNRDPQDLDP